MPTTSYRPPTAWQAFEAKASALDSVDASLIADANQAIENGDFARADKLYRSLLVLAGPASKDERRPSCE